MLKNKEKYSVAIVGATGAVGVEFLNVLAKRKFPIDELKLLASARSVGKKINYEGRDYAVSELTQNSFANVDIALFSAGSARSKEFAAAAVKAGCVVIDNSSAFRLNADVPLVVPEVNPEALQNHHGIIANPNCTTILLCVVLAPIHKINPVKRVTVATYQAVSGAGAQAVAEWRQQACDYVAGKKMSAEIFPHVIFNNIFSHNTAVGENGYNEEEMKMVNETRKIMEIADLAVSPTCVRVPIERAHSEAVSLELANDVDLERIVSALAKAPGVKIVDDARASHFPMPSEASGVDDVLVGRIRRDLNLKKGLNLFLCGDQLLKGAALNAIQIAEMMIKIAKNK